VCAFVCVVVCVCVCVCTCTSVGVQHAYMRLRVCVFMLRIRAHECSSVYVCVCTGVQTLFTSWPRKRVAIILQVIIFRKWDTNYWVRATDYRAHLLTITCLWVTRCIYHPVVRLEYALSHPETWIPAMATHKQKDSVSLKRRTVGSVYMFCRI